MSSWYAILGLLLVLVSHSQIARIVERLARFAPTQPDSRDSGADWRRSVCRKLRCGNRQAADRLLAKIARNHLFGSQSSKIRHPSLDALGTVGRENAAE